MGMIMKPFATTTQSLVDTKSYEIPIVSHLARVD